MRLSSAAAGRLCSCALAACAWALLLLSCCPARTVAAPRLAAPVFAETFHASAVSVNVKTLAVHELDIWLDRKRNAERLDDRTSNSSFLLAYGKGMLYVTRRGACSAYRLTPTLAAPRLPRDSTLLATDVADINGLDNLEHWSNSASKEPDFEEVWVERKGRTCEPVRERFRRHGPARGPDVNATQGVEVQVDYTHFEAKRLDPAIFRVPDSIHCKRKNDDQTLAEAITAQRALLHTTPMYLVIAGNDASAAAATKGREQRIDDPFAVGGEF
jgi:hypothetical protein